MSKMKTSLYNNDGSLCSEAQFLLSFKSSNMSRTEWRKILNNFEDKLSSKDLKEFKKLKAKVANANWRAENPEKSKANSTNWRAENPEKSKANSTNWRAENPEKSKANSTNWRVENPERSASYMNDYHKQRKAKDPLYHLQYNMRILGNRVVKQLSLGKKPACTEKWQGCSADELKTYLESLFTKGMTWENYGEWHVDHIRPVCSFSAEEWEQVNHYTNLQPLWAEDNYAKISSDLKQKKS